MPEILEKVICHHCGEECEDTKYLHDLAFCCIGCKTVYEILEDNNLCGYYDLDENAGISLKSKSFGGKFDYLNNQEIENDLLDFKSEKLHKVTLYIPAVHCTSCVWLLENFHKIRQGVSHARLNFTKKELSIAFRPEEVTLKEIVELLATLGYEPLISLESSDSEKGTKKSSNRLIRQIAVTGFCAGNIMLFSFPEYFNFDLENASDAGYQQFFLYLNVALAIPVYFYGAFDYLKGAWVSIKELLRKNTTVLSVDIPIALGISALFFRSLYETLINHGGAFWDSMAGLVFFLLVGKWVQAKTFDALSFERNYRSYFPLAVEVKKDKEHYQYKNVEQLQKEDIIRIHHEELIPADSILAQGRAEVDYSFVTGESEPVRIKTGELIYAGGRQIGEAIELIVSKEVSKSYLTQLWNNSTFDKNKLSKQTKLANNFSKYFTYITLSIALLTAIYWQINDPTLVWPAFTAVLMVACPCALTLSMPFTMGTVMGIFGKNKFYVKNPNVIQLIAEVKDMVFDKTGTLTKSSAGEVAFVGENLSDKEKELVKSICIASTHPYAKLLAKNLVHANTAQNDYFFEQKGAGMEAIINGVAIKLGNAKYLAIPAHLQSLEANVYVKIDNTYRGYFSMKPAFRKGLKSVLASFVDHFKMHLISGDNARAKNQLAGYFKEQENLHFELKPQAKLDFIKDLQKTENTVLMLGDGLNDAGALGQADVGIALTEDAQAFTPASDAILDASQFEKLPLFMKFSKKSVAIVKISFLLSLVYNFICVGWAVTGQLSPVLAAIFMPLSSITVVLFAVILTYIYGYKMGLLERFE